MNLLRPTVSAFAGDRIEVEKKFLSPPKGLSFSEDAILTELVEEPQTHF